MKFLLVRFSAIGDCVMAAHAATSVRRAHPDAVLAWAIEARCSPVADTSSLLSLKHEFPREKWKRQAWSPATWWDTLRTYTALRKHKFDLGADLQGHSKTALCLYLAKPRKRIAAAATDSLAQRLNPVVEGDPNSMHTVEWNLRVLRHLDDFPEVQQPMMPPLEKKAEPMVATISTGAGAADKRWPIDRWMTVAEGLEALGLTVYFLGGPTDPQPACRPERNLVGKLPLVETMAMVAGSVIHLAADTGTGHMAAAYGVPVVSVFGPTFPLRYRPYTEKGVVLRNGRDTTSVEAGEVLAAASGLILP